MGLNLNINNVSFASLEKYDGKKKRNLKKNEIAQIAGRAGRNEKMATLVMLLRLVSFQNN